jgi:DUF3071 family protein
VARVSLHFAPVLAERIQILDDAQSATLSKPRRGESARPLGAAVTRHLAPSSGVHPETVEWTTRRRADGSWVVRLEFVARARRRVAQWAWDPRTRELTALDGTASGLGFIDPSGATRPIAALSVRTKPAARKKTARKSAARKKKTAARKTTARKTTAKKAARKTTAKKAARKTTAKKAAGKATARKKTARKTTARRKTATRTTVARKTTAKKSARKTTARKKPAARRATGRSRSTRSR